MTTTARRVDVDLTLSDGEPVLPRKDPRTEICNLISSDDEAPQRGDSSEFSGKAVRQVNRRSSQSQTPLSREMADSRIPQTQRPSSSFRRGEKNLSTPPQQGRQPASAPVSSNPRISDPLAHRSRASPNNRTGSNSSDTQRTVQGTGLNARYPLDNGRKLPLWDELQKQNTSGFLGTKIPLHNDLLTRPTRSDDEDDADSALNRAIEQVMRGTGVDANRVVPQNRRQKSNSNAQAHRNRAPKRVNGNKDALTAAEQAPPAQADEGIFHVDSEEVATFSSPNHNEDFQDAASAQLLASVDRHSATDASPTEAQNIEPVIQAEEPLDSPVNADKAGESPVRESNSDILDQAVVPALNDDPHEEPVLPETRQQPEPLPDGDLGDNDLLLKPVEPFPLHAKEIQSYLIKCIDTMHEAQADLIKSSLQMARLRSEEQWESQDLTGNPWTNVAPILPTNLQSATPQNLDSNALKFESNVYGTGYTPREKLNVNVPTISFESDAPTLPRYKSIVRLGPNVLAENDRTLKYLPYFPDEEGVDGDDSRTELRLELEQRFKSRVDRLAEFQTCIGKADLYREGTKAFLQGVGSSFNDILYYLHFDDKNDGEWQPPQLGSDDAFAALTATCHVRCPVCDQSYGGVKWDRLFPRLRTPSDRELGLAALAYFAFEEITRFSIWHVAVTDPEITSLVQSQQQSQDTVIEAAGLRCWLCGMHDCPTHGAFKEHEESDSDSEDDDSSDTDNELGHNFRQRISQPLPKRKNPAKEHTCGPYCVDPRTRLHDLMGSHEDGTVFGQYNKSQEAPGPLGLEDDEICDDRCFWQVELRMYDGESPSVEDNNSALQLQRFRDWSPEDISLYWRLLPIYVKHRRGPCLMAMSIPQACIKVFVEMLFDMYSVKHTAADDPGITVQPKTYHARDGSWWVEHSITHLHDERVPFQPCSHEGACEGNPACSCWRTRVTCEHLCGCAKDCIRRYEGCKCAAKGRPCTLEDKCDCMLLNRECDPWVCKSCGVVEVLDPVNRHDDTILKDRCRNANIQRSRPKRTLKGASEVQGWGLFAGEEIRPHEFIGEYRGEVINRAEADRRGAVYHYRGLEYLFSLNRDQEVDSSRAGNKMRFINNSNDPKNQNCYSRKMFCNGVQRIGLFAKGPKVIEPGVELFFCYGYPASITKYFWERGEKPEKGLATSLSRPRKTKALGKVRAVKEKTKPFGEVKKKNKGGRPPKVRLTTPEKQILDKGKGKTSIEESEPLEDPQSTGRKRKRILIDSLDPGMDMFDGPAGNSSEDGEPRTFGLRHRKHASSPAYVDSGEIPQSEDEEYNQPPGSESEEIDDQDDDQVEEDEEEEEEDSDAAGPSWGNRKLARHLPAGDTRYGGEVQKRGWITRRKNIEERRRKEAQSGKEKNRRGK